MPYQRCNASSVDFRDYAAIVFFANNRFETGKRKLQYLTFQDFAFCAGQLINNWTVGAVGKSILWLYMAICSFWDEIDKVGAYAAFSNHDFVESELWFILLRSRARLLESITSLSGDRDHNGALKRVIFTLAHQGFAIIDFSPPICNTQHLDSNIQLSAQSNL